MSTQYGEQFPSAAGFRNIGSQAMQYIPVIFSGKLLTKFYAKSNLAAISNTDYEGEIRRYGDTVKIRTTPDITIRDYVKGQALRNELPESESVELTINKGKYWSFATDDVDDVQTDIKSYASQWADDAAEQMRVVVEREAFADFPSDSHEKNQGANAGVISGIFNLGTTSAPVTLSANDIVNQIVSWGAVLDEQNIPDASRFVVLPAWAIAMLKTSDIKDASLTGDSTSPIRNGLVGRIDRFNIFNSNLLNSYASGSDLVTDVVFGSDIALTFATQIVKSKVTDNPDGFGQLYRGLQVYGYSVVQPTALGVVRVKSGWPTSYPIP